MSRLSALFKLLEVYCVIRVEPRPDVMGFLSATFLSHVLLTSLSADSSRVQRLVRESSCSSFCMTRPIKANKKRSSWLGLSMSPLMR